MPEDKLFFEGTEVHSSLGSYDVEVETKEAIYIFEFKMGGSLKMQSLKSKKQTMQKNIVPATKVFLLGVSIT